MVNTITTEFNDLSVNNNVVSLIKMEKSMTNTTYQQIEIEKGGMRIVLEFPSKSEQEETVRQEVKSILSSALQEQIQKIS